ncbi:MAG: hypothetical protein Q7S55_02370 [Nanoarchaeota archaeon]|nr:hypothetical protein [Nanoarchaeota archaeon]
MKKKLSFTQIMRAEGISDFEELTVEDLERMIREGKIQTAYSHVQTIEEFYGFRRNVFDIETWNEFKPLIDEHKVLSLKYDSLGELLQTTNYFSEGSSVDSEWEMGETFESEETYQEAFDYVKSTLGINPKKQAPFLVQGFADKKSIDGILAFVKSWSTAQGRSKKWNPSYAKPLQEEKLYTFTARDPKIWLKELDRNISETVLAKNCIYLPFDSWTLAECFRRWYEK